jgi:hypothetical protein
VEELSRIFKEMADLTDFIGDSPFKSRTYRLASEVAKMHGTDTDKLSQVKGIGKAILEKTVEYANTGKIKKHDDLMKLVPQDFLSRVFEEDPVLLGKKWREDVKKRYFRIDGSLKTIPSKFSVKFYVLREISKHFKKNRVYTEKDINSVLSPIYPDHVEIRRYLVDFGFLERKADGSAYKKI